MFSPCPAAGLFLQSRTRPSRDTRRSLAVVPLIGDQRCYGEAPARLRRGPRDARVQGWRNKGPVARLFGAASSECVEITRAVKATRSHPRATFKPTAWGGDYDPQATHIVTQRIVSWGRSRDGSGFARGNRSVDTEGFCKSQMTLNSGLRRQRATLGRFRWNGRNSVPGSPRGHPEATLRPCGSQPVGTPRPP